MEQERKRMEQKAKGEHLLPPGKDEASRAQRQALLQEEQQRRLSFLEQERLRARGLIRSSLLGCLLGFWFTGMDRGRG